MSKIFELFGYRLDAWGNEARENCRRAWCPFMDAECDGGGNRYLSGIKLTDHDDLQQFFPDKKEVQCGVCSLQLRDHAQPWIVCPRRLLSLRNSVSPHQQAAYRQVLKYGGLPDGTTARVWSEVKVKVATANCDDESKSFDYAFDYVLATTDRKPLSEVAKIISCSERKAERMAQQSGYTLAKRDGVIWIDDFPTELLLIVEIMTSSTSGGNKDKRTQIAMAFEDAVKNGLDHSAPGINYRQVWARMVSQLIVKSQVGLAWGGRTIWLLQDVLADYISATTALNLAKYAREHAAEVNILAFGYGRQAEAATTADDIIELADSQFYSGPISASGTAMDGFVDIVKLGAAPPREKLLRALFQKSPCASLKA